MKLTGYRERHRDEAQKPHLPIKKRFLDMAPLEMFLFADGEGIIRCT